MSFPTVSELVFAEQHNHNFSKTLGELKRSNLSIRNRLESILQDAAFARTVALAYSRPLLANERCGSWYVDPETKKDSAFFKSTDGHTNAWKFSTKRLNLHLLDTIGKNDGCIIIDSTRRGKRMPDALSKTIPIWCSTINVVLFPNEPEYHELYTPPQIVSRSEHAQIAALIPSFTTTLRSMDIPVETLRSKITKPLRPFWITPESDIAPTTSIFDNYHPIICCTVSRCVLGGEMSEGGYIQGAGDDAENWAYGLTPQVFWAYKEQLLATPESDFPDVITKFVERGIHNTSVEEAYVIRPGCWLFFTNLAALSRSEPDPDACIVEILPKVTEESTWRLSPSHLRLGLGPGKLGSKNLRGALPLIIEFVSSNLGVAGGEASLVSECKKRAIVACEDGRNISAGVVLAILCLISHDIGLLLLGSQVLPKPDKNMIKSRLTWITASKPDAIPSRATMHSVNSFLMPPPGCPGDEAGSGMSEYLRAFFAKA